MKILIESPVTGTISSKETTNNGNVVFEAILHTSDEPNRNGRIYPLSHMLEAIERLKKDKDRIFGGELDHPLPTEDRDYSFMRHMTLSLRDLSHIIKKCWFEGNKLIGVVETAPTTNGQFLANLIKNGINVGFSLRAISDNLENDGEYEIVRPPITIIAIDAVSAPSHPNAKVTKMINIHQESLNKISEITDPNTTKLINEHLSLTESYRKEDIFSIGSYIRYQF